MSDQYTLPTGYVRHVATERFADRITGPEFDTWLASVKSKAWEQGRKAEETSWRHVFDGHPVEEGDMCHECSTDNPYLEGGTDE